MDVSLVTTTLVFICTFAVAYYLTRRRKGVPPGPPLFPVIGNLHYLASGDLMRKLQDLRTKYGDIYSLYIGNELTIFLNGHETIHRMLIKNGTLFNARPLTNYDKLIVKYPAIIMAHGELWKQQRQFIQHTLQDLCFKNSGHSLENIIHEEANLLICELGKLDGEFDIEDFINVAVSNVISTVTFSRRHEFSDDGIKLVSSLFRTQAEEYITQKTLCGCFPFLQHLPFDLLRVKRTFERHAKILSFFKPYIKDAEAKFDNDQDTESLVSRYLQRIHGYSSSEKENTFNLQQLEYTMYEMFGAGSETTTNTIRWILLFLIRHPEIQEKAHQEIASKLRDELPIFADRKRLPYTYAVILEGLRIQTVAPLGVPHTVTRDCVIGGYLFPKNCTVITNLSSACKDPVVWDEPDEFRPERFLDESGQSVIVPPELIPFSLGPRACLGETLAKYELFLFIVMIVQKFRILPEADNKMPKVKGNLGLTWCPETFKLRLQSRKLA